MKSLHCNLLGKDASVPAGKLFQSLCNCDTDIKLRSYVFWDISPYGSLKVAGILEKHSLKLEGRIVKEAKS
jgi:hypothetical protein